MLILKGDVQAYEIEHPKGGKVYVSWSGDRVRGQTDGVLQISGLFGEKLGLRDGDQVSKMLLSIL